MLPPSPAPSRILERYGILATASPRPCASVSKRGIARRDPRDPQAAPTPCSRASATPWWAATGWRWTRPRSAARELGFRTLVLSSEIQGETRDVARMHAAIAREYAKSDSR